MGNRSALIRVKNNRRILSSTREYLGHGNVVCRAFTGSHKIGYVYENLSN